MMEDADTEYFNVSLSNGALRISIDNNGTNDNRGDNKFTALDDGTGDPYVLTVTPSTVGGKVTKWNLGGSLATKLGLQNE
jgi:hypothetical protein